ncbi:MAG: tetratricopeptide repeat protein [Candidatus Obscuribacterales bacterium]|nr:tetratricopeptide repeat protein [Candidatus Obscuribacterales bacterium]
MKYFNRKPPCLPLGMSLTLALAVFAPAIAETGGALEKVKITPSGNSIIQKGYVSSAPSPVRLAGEEVFSIHADAGGFTAQERSLIIERNLNNALIAARDRSPDSVELVTVNGLPVIRLGSKHIVTIDNRLAQLHGTTCARLAEEWANNMRKALADSTRVNNYVAQLAGDYLYSPYSLPYRKAQWQAARLNHAAGEARADMPLDLTSSASVRDEGFDSMLKRDPVAAEIHFRKALAMEAGNERAHYGLGAALLKQGRVDEAIAELDMARWLDPDDAQVHLALGEAMESKGLDRAAIERYREAGLLHPEDPTPALYIADIRESRDDIGKSVVELTEAAKNCPQSDYLRLRRKDQIGWRLSKPF